MNRIVAVAAGLLMVMNVAQAEQADMSKVTCDEVTHAYVDDVVIIGAWLSGYYHGKRNTTVVDEKQLSANAKKVMHFCSENPKMTVMQAVDELSKSP